MDLPTFWENFEVIAEAPGGVQRLRELILDLAVRGKLVPQDPADEPANVLLDSIQQIKKEMISNKVVPKPKKLSYETLNHESTSFDLPPGWLWSRLEDISAYIQRGKSPQYAEHGNVRVISQKCVQWLGFTLEPARFLDDEIIAKYSSERFLQKDDLLWNSTGTGTVGRVSVFPDTVKQVSVADSHVTVIRPITCSTDFIYSWLRSHHVQSRISDKTSGTTKQQELNTSTVRLQAIPLPPLAEQKRIVAKVDELMALCDRYEVLKCDRNSLRTKTRASAIDALMNAETDESLNTAWSFIQDNWDNFSKDSKDIEDFRKITLNLAIRGKLVAQDPSEENADKLLSLIKDKHTANQKQYRKPTKLLPIGEVVKPFDLPLGWSWCRFTDIGFLGRGKSKHRPRNDPSLYIGGTIPLVQTGDVARADRNIKTYTALYNETGVAQSRLWPKGTLCITIAANIADSAVLDFDACFPDSVVGFLPTYPIRSGSYFEFFIRTMKSTLESFAPSTAQKNINLAILDEVLIPLPPLAEQKRIVAKIDQLMTLCDTFETHLRDIQEKAIALAAAVVEQLEV